MDANPFTIRIPQTALDDSKTSCRRHGNLAGAFSTFSTGRRYHVAVTLLRSKNRNCSSTNYAAFSVPCVTHRGIDPSWNGKEKKDASPHECPDATMH